MATSKSFSSSIHVLMANMLQWFLAVILASVQYSKRVLGAQWIRSYLAAQPSESRLRVLHPKEIVFDDVSRMALDLLQDHYPRRQQSTTTIAVCDEKGLDGITNNNKHCIEPNFGDDGPDIEAPPSVMDNETEESSSLSSESESSSSTSDEHDIARSEVSVFGSRPQQTSNANDIVQQSLASLQSAGNGDRLTLTCTGYKGGLLESQINQDRATIVYPLLDSAGSSQDKEEVSNGPSSETMLLGVLDGHGMMGHQCAEFCRNELELDINLRMKKLVDNSHGGLSTLSPQVVAKELERIFDNVDARLPYRWGRDGGTTCNMVLQLGEWIYMINTGDSQSLLGAFIASTQESLVLRVTERHVPTLPLEVQRIQRAGGQISADQQYVVYRHVEEDHGLAMTRSLGDHMAPGVIPTPAITFVSKHALVEQALQSSQVHQLNSGSYPTNQSLDASDIALFAVAASDGILDVLRPKQHDADKKSLGTLEMARVVGEAFFGRDRQCQHPFVGVKRFIDDCAARWYQDSDGSYRDDIVIAASKLQ